MILRNCVLENFPILEDDFDALTDYALFSKMVAYTRELKDYIENNLEDVIEKYVEDNFNNIMINAMYDSDNEKLILYKEVQNG